MPGGGVPTIVEAPSTLWTVFCCTWTRHTAYGSDEPCAVDRRRGEDLGELARSPGSKGESRPLAVNSNPGKELDMSAILSGDGRVEAIVDRRRTDSPLPGGLPGDGRRNRSHSANPRDLLGGGTRKLHAAFAKRFKGPASPDLKPDSHDIVTTVDTVEDIGDRWEVKSALLETVRHTIAAQISRRLLPRWASPTALLAVPHLGRSKKVSCFNLPSSCMTP